LMSSEVIAVLLSSWEPTAVPRAGAAPPLGRRASRGRYYTRRLLSF
jgi:hypothetical protein